MNPERDRERADYEKSKTDATEKNHGQSVLFLKTLSKSMLQLRFILFCIL